MVNIKKINKALTDAIARSAEENKETVEISTGNAIDLCFILPKIQELVETVAQ